MMFLFLDATNLSSYLEGRRVFEREYTAALHMVTDECAKVTRHIKTLITKHI